MNSVLQPTAIKVPKSPRTTGLVGTWMGDFNVVHRLNLKAYLVQCKYCGTVFRSGAAYIQKYKNQKCKCKQGTVELNLIVPPPPPPKPTLRLDPVFQVGARYGRLVVVEQSKEKIGDGYPWLCRCDCGTERYWMPGQLRSPVGIRSCGCLKREKTTQVQPGETYGKLTVIGKSQAGWLCQCECGKDVTTAAANLVRGYRISCGCSRRGKKKVE